jgi:uncharacterized protein YeaO (DUF488 family)
MWAKFIKRYSRELSAKWEGGLNRLKTVTKRYKPETVTA